jgi:hypothetical protein
MAQKDLDFADVVSGLQQMGGKAVPQCVQSFTVFTPAFLRAFS